EVLWLEGAKHIDGMSSFVAGSRERAQLARERLHGAQARVLRRLGKRPRIPERHRPKPPRLAASPRPHAAVDVEDRHAIDRAPAELIRRPVHELLELVVDVDDADVSGARADPGWRAVRAAA